MDRDPFVMGIREGHDIFWVKFNAKAVINAVIGSSSGSCYYDCIHKVRSIGLILSL